MQSALFKTCNRQPSTSTISHFKTWNRRPSTRTISSLQDVHPSPFFSYNQPPSMGPTVTLRQVQSATFKMCNRHPSVSTISSVQDEHRHPSTSTISPLTNVQPPPFYKYNQPPSRQHRHPSASAFSLLQGLQAGHSSSHRPARRYRRQGLRAGHSS